jgi:hypothetical protein
VQLIIFQYTYFLGRGLLSKTKSGLKIASLIDI